MSESNGKSLRAAGYCRTSSERQRDNTSIPEQKDRIKRFIDYTGWTFTTFYVDECKSGSRIAGREAFQQALRDLEGDRVDVLVPLNCTRYGRDGVDILATMKTVKQQFNKDVVDANGGLDTRIRTNVLGNYVHAGMAEQEKLNFLDRTKRGKIARAGQGRPVGSKRPYGRQWDKEKKQWHIIPKDKDRVEQISARYLAGEPMPLLAKEYGINHAYLGIVLKYRCGDTWDQKVVCKELGIDVAIPTKVPRLLPESTIKAVRRKMEANRTWLHGRPKHDYLLGGYIRCAACGYQLTGQPSPKGRLYYRHSKHGAAKCSLRPRTYVPAPMIERAVLDDLFNRFGNPAEIARGVKAATPERQQLDAKQEHIDKQLAQINKRRQFYLTLIDRGALTLSQAEAKLTDLNQQEAVCHKELDGVQEAREYVPDEETIRLFAEVLADNTILVYDQNGLKANGGNKDLCTWFDLLNSRRDQRALIQSVFSAPLLDGKAPGVYVKPDLSFGYHGLMSVKGLVSRVTQNAACLPDRVLP